MADILENYEGPKNPSDDAEKQEPGATEADKAKAMEDVQKEAAEEREEDGGYQ